MSHDNEDDVHVLAPDGCPGLVEPKQRIIAKMKEAEAKCVPPINISTDGDIFTQFVCDPSRFNLGEDSRVNLNNKGECENLFKCTMDYIFSIVNL